MEIKQSIICTAIAVSFAGADKIFKENNKAVVIVMAFDEKNKPIVLNKDWFVYQEAYKEDVDLRQHADNALLRFMHKLTYDLSSIKMCPMSLDKYYSVSYGAR